MSGSQGSLQITPKRHRNCLSVRIHVYIYYSIRITVINVSIQTVFVSPFFSKIIVSGLIIKMHFFFSFPSFLIVFNQHGSMQRV